MTRLSDPFQPIPFVKLEHPEWSKNAAIYEINMRQFTKEGTFRAAEGHLRRLKSLGVDILWLMPIHPIGKKNRKGILGSPYAVCDYYGVNPEFGTFTDLRHFVDSAHELGMHVILDWVANHTALDNQLVREHPEWYTRDWKGDFRPTPWWEWQDVIELDYSKPALREYMIEALKHWVTAADIDGYRCDAAGFVPTDFWENVRKELDAIKPVFMLAEWEARDLHAEAFDMTYGWSWFDAMHQVLMRKTDLTPLYAYYASNEKAFPKKGMRMLFVTNHDKNAWDGTEFEHFGNGVEPAIVLSVMSEGLPLIYNGQEAGNTKSLKFFEKDPIQWREHRSGELYRKLLALKKTTTALWNAEWGATMIKVRNSVPTSILSFVRQNECDKVFAVLNFSDIEQHAAFEGTLFYGTYTDYFANATVTLNASTELELVPWGFRVFVSK